MRSLRIGVVGYNGITALNLIGPIECFTSAAKASAGGRELPCYEIVLISFDGKHITADSGVKFAADVEADDTGNIDTLLIPGGAALRAGNVAERIAEWVRRRAAGIRRIASICTGIYALAPTGLIDGRRVTTHWRFAADVAKRFPQLQVDARELVIHEGKYYSSGGATAGIDLALALIEEDYGEEVGLSVARTMLVYRHRDGDQEQYAEPEPPYSDDEEKLGDLAHWIEENLHTSLSLTEVATKAGVSCNHIIAAFKERFGTTPSAFVKGVRLNESRRKLARGEPVEQVAKFARFASRYYFEREFRWRFGIRPDEYRTRFAPIRRLSDGAQSY